MYRRIDSSAEQKRGESHQAEHAADSAWRKLVTSDRLRWLVHAFLFGLIWGSLVLIARLHYSKAP